MAYWDFLQMTPENQAAARNMSWGQALKSEIPGTSNYRGYNPFYKGADATGLGGYLKQGGQSLAGNFQAGSNVGGATPLMRKLAMSPVARGIGTVGRFAGLTNPVGAAAMSAWAAPKAIDYLTERDPDATKSSLFGIDLTQNANEQAALPESNLADWGFDSGVVPGDEIQEQVTETENFPLDPNWQHQLALQGMNREGIEGPGMWHKFKSMFQRPEAKQKEFEAYEQSKGPGGWGDFGDYKGNIWGGNKINVVDPVTGATVLQNKNFDSMFGSESVEEMIAKKEAWARKRRAKGEEYLSEELKGWLDAIDKQEGAGDKPGQGPTSGYTGPKTFSFDPGAFQRSGGQRQDKPGGFTDPGKDSYGPHKAQGGYMRSRYNRGGRVGILAAF